MSPIIRPTTADDIEAAIIAQANATARGMMRSIQQNAETLPPENREALEVMFPTLENTAATNFEQGARWMLLFLTTHFQPEPARTPHASAQKRRPRQL